MTQPPKRPAPSRRPRVGAALIGLAVSGGALYFMLRDVDQASIGLALSDVAPGPTAALVAMSFVIMLLIALRLHLLTAPFHHYGLGSQYFAVLLGFLGNAVIPFRAGDLLRMDYLARRGEQPYSSVLGALAIERLLDLAFLCLCFFVSIPLSAGGVPVVTGISVLGILVVLALATLVWISRRPTLALALLERLAGIGGMRVKQLLLPHLGALLEGLSALRSARAVVAVLGLTVLRWGLGILNITLWFTALHLSLPWYASVVVLAFITFGTALPSSIAAAGTYHYAVVAGLAVFGVVKEVAVPVAIFGHMLTYVPATIASATVVGLAITRGRYRMPSLTARGRSAPDAAPPAPTDPAEP